MTKKGRPMTETKPVVKKTSKPLLNSPQWWDIKGEKYLRASDLRERPDEFRTGAFYCTGPVLEVGSAFGRFADYLPCDTQYVGVELSAMMCARARRDRPWRVFLCGDFWRMGRTYYGAFSTVCAFQVLEHYKDVERTVKRLRLFARDRLVFSVPRGLPTKEARENGHVIGWEDEAALHAALEKFGQMEFWRGRENHICGTLTWGTPIGSRQAER